MSEYLSLRETSWMQSLPGHLNTEGEPAGGRPEPKREVRIRVKDFQNQSGTTITLEDDRVQPEDTLIRGNFFNRDLRQGLNLRCSNTHEEHAFTSDSTHAAGLSCIFFLQGEVGVNIGGRDFTLDPGNRRDHISAAGVLKRCPQSFKRVTKAPQYVRHLVVTASPDWLASSGFEQRLSNGINRQLQHQEMASQQWQPSPRLGGLIQEVFSPSLLIPELLDLHLEARAIDIVSETLATLIQAEEPKLPRLGRHEQIRLQRAKDFILAEPAQAFSVDDIAQQAGISASGLQRLFQRAESCSVFDYVRQVRLEKARVLLMAGNTSVQEVANLAGYKNPANFATAFKRRFGLTPRQLIGT